MNRSTDAQVFGERGAAFCIFTPSALSTPSKESRSCNSGTAIDIAIADRLLRLQMTPTIRHNAVSLVEVHVRLRRIQGAGIRCRRQSS